MSLLAQIALGITLREKYHRQDFEALSLTLDVYQEIRRAEFKSRLVGPADKAMNVTPGGIDLRAKGVDIDTNNRSPQTAYFQPHNALRNVEINGLYIKSIEIKPLTNVLQLLGVSNS